MKDWVEKKGDGKGDIKTTESYWFVQEMGGFVQRRGGGGVVSEKVSYLCIASIKTAGGRTG